MGADLDQLPLAPSGWNARRSGGVDVIASPAMRDDSQRFDGLNNAPGRTFIYMPAITGADDISSYDRREGDRKAVWLHSNVGIASAFINRLATKTVGTGMRAQALTDDDDWNRRNEERFAEKAESAMAIDAQGKWNFYDAQWLFAQQESLRGDFFAALTESKETGSAQFLMYEAGQIGDDTFNIDPRQPTGWSDGVRTVAPGRPVGYRVLKPGGGHVDLPARDMIHFATHRPPGARRGITRMIKALNHMVDIVDNRAAIKHGIKLANSIGYYLRTQMGGHANGIGGGMGAVLGEEAEKIAGTAKDELALRDVMIKQNGKAVALGVNQTMETLSDDRPHENGRAFEKDLIADIALGFDVLADVVISIADLSNSQGRLALQDLQEFIEPRQAKLARTFCSRFYVYDTAKEIKAGRMPMPKGDPRWWRHGWLTPRKVTIDVGREGALEIKQQSMGLLTLSDFWGCRSKGWKSQVDQGIAEIKYKWAKVCEARGVDVEENPAPLELFYADGKIKAQGTGGGVIPQA